MKIRITEFSEESIWSSESTLGSYVPWYLTLIFVTNLLEKFHFLEVTISFSHTQYVALSQRVDYEHCQWMHKRTFIPNHKAAYVQTNTRINQYNKMTITSIYYFPAQLYASSMSFSRIEWRTQIEKTHRRIVKMRRMWWKRRALAKFNADAL